MIFTIALRNLLRQRERFAVLFVTLMLGSWLFVVLLGTAGSFSGSLGDKAARYFSGHVTVTGWDVKLDGKWIGDEATIRAAVDALRLPMSWTRRSINYDQSTTLFFGGTSQRQRRLIGVDWTLEKQAFRDLDYLSGNSDEMIRGDGILISDAAAARLKVRVGDDVLVLMATKTGQKNTLDLKVRGIFRDASFFGYSSYVDIRTLNKALGVPENAVAELGMVFSPGSDDTRIAERIWAALDGKVPLVPLSRTQERADIELQESAEAGHSTYAVLSLTARLGPVRQVLEALSLVTWSLNALFLIIVLVGVNNTYRMVVWERIREIGTLRALGMTRGKLASVFLTEAAFLGLAGAIAGWLLGNFVLWVASTIDFGDNVIVAMFLTRGHLAWSVPWSALVGVIASMVVTALAGSVGPSWRAAAWKPVDALRHES